MKSLKQLLDADEKELSSWENKYRSKIIHLLKSIEIDTIYGMQSYRLIVANEFKKFTPLFASLTPEFTHKDLYRHDSLPDVARSESSIYSVENRGLINFGVDYR